MPPTDARPQPAWFKFNCQPLRGAASSQSQIGPLRAAAMALPGPDLLCCHPLQEQWQRGHCGTCTALTCQQPTAPRGCNEVKFMSLRNTLLPAWCVPPTACSSGSMNRDVAPPHAGVAGEDCRSGGMLNLDLGIDQQRRGRPGAACNMCGSQLWTDGARCWPGRRAFPRGDSRTRRALGQFPQGPSRHLPAKHQLASTASVRVTAGAWWTLSGVMLRASPLTVYITSRRTATAGLLWCSASLCSCCSPRALPSSCWATGACVPSCQ
jgi:hypothetical protein